MLLNTQLYMQSPPCRKQKIKKILNQATTKTPRRPPPTPSASIYTSPQPGDSNAPRRSPPTPSASTHIGSTSHIQHRSIHTQVNNLTPPQPRTPKKSPRGVQRGHGFMAPLRFSSFPTKAPKNIFLPTFPSKVCRKINKILVVFTIKKVYHIKINYKQ